MRTGIRLAAAVAVLAVAAAVPSAQAIHFYRTCDPPNGQGPASGTITDDPGGSGPVAATVLMGHNTFTDASTGTPVTVVQAGQAVRWTWNSAHCHSVQSSVVGVFNSGFHYPATAPSTPRVHDFFEYPVLELTPSLAFVHTFTTPGTYTYFCIHHTIIGMNGVVVVQ